MTSVSVAVGRELFEDEVIRVVRRRLREVFQRRLAAEAGKRAAGILGGLAVPEPVVSKIVAIGFGIWTAWTIISILYDFLAMSELFEETLDRIWQATL